MEIEMTAIVTVGISGAGKTHWATEFAAPNDYVHLEFKTIHRTTGAAQLTLHEARQQMNIMIKEQANLGNDIIVDDQNLNVGEGFKLVLFLTSLGYTVRFYLFNTPFELCWSRVKHAMTERKLCAQRVDFNNMQTCLLGYKYAYQIVQRQPEEGL